MSPTFSVVIPTYGRPDFLSQAIDSVLGQTINDFEVVVVDDASPEPIALADHPAIRVLRHPTNKGPGAARNTGVNNATGRFVTFLDDDDLYMPNRLSIAAEGMESGGYPISVCWSAYIGENPTPQRVLDGDVWNHIVASTTPHLGVTTVERSALLPFDETFRSVQDVEWWLRMAETSFVSTVPRVGCLIRRHAGQRHGNTQRQRVLDTRRLMEVHRDHFQASRASAAFRWMRIGLMEDSRPAAMAALARSFVRQPTLRTLAHMARRLTQ